MKLKKVGKIGVDAGTVMVVDPCYMQDRAVPLIDIPSIFDDLGDAQHTQVGNALAVAVRSGYGDGVYNVYAIMASSKETDGWGERVMGLLVDFGGARKWIDATSRLSCELCGRHQDDRGNWQMVFSIPVCGDCECARTVEELAEDLGLEELGYTIKEVYEELGLQSE